MFSEVVTVHVHKRQREGRTLVYYTTALNALPVYRGRSRKVAYC